VTPHECHFESEALAAALQSRWPARVDPALRAHIEACPVCADVVAIAGAVDDAREEMRVGAVVPDAGRIWWGAQLRARRDAVRTAGRPITAIQVIAFACASGFLGACFGATSRWFQAVLDRAMAAIAGLDTSALVAEHGALLIVIAALALLVPAAVFLAVGRD
jgi:hypothetical protein